MKTTSRPTGRTTRGLKMAAVLAAGWLLSTAGLSARADVMEQVPSDALVVWKVNHLDATNAKLIDLFGQLGVADIVPNMKDPMAALKEATGIGPGLDTSRDAAIVLPNVPMEHAQKEPPILVLWPVSDYKAFLGSFTVVRTEGDVTVVHVKDDQDDTFIQQWGEYAAFTDKKELLSVKHDGLKPTGSAAKEMAEKDVCAYVNFPVLKTLLLPKLQASKQQVMDEVDGQAKDDNQKKVADAAIGQGFAMVERFLEDARGTTIGITIGKDGVSENMVVDFEPGSYLGKMTKSLKVTDGPLLAGLPDEKYLLFGGAVQDPQSVAGVVNDVIAPIMKELPGMGETGTKIQAAVDTYKDAMLASEGGAYGVIVPTAAPGQGPLIRYLAIAKGDGEKLKSAQIKVAQMQNELMGSFGMKEMSMMKVTVTPDERTINGVKFDKVTTDVDAANNGAAADMMRKQLDMMYGPDGQVMLIGAVDAKTVIDSMGLDDQTLSAAIDAIKANKDVLSDQVKVVDAGLPKSRASVGYIDVGQIVTTAIGYAKAQGANVPFQFQPNLPPIGVAAGTDGSALRFDVYVPMPLLQSMFQAGMQTYMQFGNRGGI